MSEDRDDRISGSKTDTADPRTHGDDGSDPRTERSPDPAPSTDPQGAAPDAEAADLDSDAGAALRAERDEAVDRMKRIQADFENYQKRMGKERAEWESRTLGSFAEGLLPLLDDFERALAASRENEGDTGFFQGVEMIHGQFVRHLESLGVRPIEAEGHPFDPTVHEAVAQQPSADHPDKTVLQEVRRGYALGDRVLRPAQVLISRAPGDGDA